MEERRGEEGEGIKGREDEKDSEQLHANNQVKSIRCDRTNIVNTLGDSGRWIAGGGGGGGVGGRDTWTSKSACRGAGLHSQPPSVGPALTTTGSRNVFETPSNSQA